MATCPISNVPHVQICLLACSCALSILPGLSRLFGVLSLQPNASAEALANENSALLFPCRIFTPPELPISR